MRRDIRFAIVIVVLITLLLISVSLLNMKKVSYLKENGVVGTAKLTDQRRSVNSSGGMHEPILKLFFKYIGYCEFKTNDGVTHLLTYESTNKNSLTDTKKFYFNSNSFSEYVWEDYKPFSWVKECVILGVECVILVLIACFIKNKRDRKIGK